MVREIYFRKGSDGYEPVIFEDIKKGDIIHKPGNDYDLLITDSYEDDLEGGTTLATFLVPKTEFIRGSNE